MVSCKLVKAALCCVFLTYQQLEKYVDFMDTKLLIAVPNASNIFQVHLVFPLTIRDLTDHYGQNNQ